MQSPHEEMQFAHQKLTTVLFTYLILITYLDTRSASVINYWDRPALRQFSFIRDLSELMSSFMRSTTVWRITRKII